MSAPPLTNPPALLARRHARMGRYAVWQSRDFLFNIAIVTLVIFGMVGWLFHLNLGANEELMRARGMRLTIPMKLNLYLELLGMFATVGPIIAVSGIVSSDRAGGFTRFLFAKPVSPIRFYVQSLLIRFAGYMLIGCVLLFAWSRLHPPAFDWKFFADIAICFVSIGGIVFLASVASRYDGLIAIAFLLLSAVFWEKWETVGGVRHWVTWLLPPTTKFGDIHAWYLGLNAMGTLAELPFATKWVVWNAGYGLACVLLGLVMLRRIPLTKT
jgi:hypothetical protein